MKTMKRILSLLLALMLFAGVLPAQALAAEENLPVVEETIPETVETVPEVEETLPEEEETVEQVEETVPEPVVLEPVVEETAPAVAEPETAEEATVSATKPEAEVMMRGAVSQKAIVTQVGGERILEAGEVQFAEPEVVEISGHDYTGEYMSLSEGAVQFKKELMDRNTDIKVMIKFSWSGYANRDAAVEAVANYLLNSAFEHTGKPDEGDYIYKHIYDRYWSCSYWYYTNNYTI